MTAPKANKGFRSDAFLHGAMSRDGCLYVGKIPKWIPDGFVLVHNQVYPLANRVGTHGSRIWLAVPSGKYESCDCGWQPQLGAHYRVKEPSE